VIDWGVLPGDRTGDSSKRDRELDCDVVEQRVVRFRRVVHFSLIETQSLTRLLTAILNVVSNIAPSSGFSVLMSMVRSGLDSSSKIADSYAENGFQDNTLFRHPFLKSIVRVGTSDATTCYVLSRLLRSRIGRNDSPSTGCRP
jgi:hypothetical protein